MQNKRKDRKHAPRPRSRMSEREIRKTLRELVQHAVPSLPAPPGTVPPARWVSVRQAAQWRRDIERKRRAGKPWQASGEGGMTLREFAEREYPRTNDICLSDDMQIVRLVGVAKDPYDLYYIEQRMGGERRYSSAVCRCASLRGALRADLYKRIERMFGLNGCQPVRQMLILRESRPRARGKTGRK